MKTHPFRIIWGYPSKLGSSYIRSNVVNATCKEVAIDVFRKHHALRYHIMGLVILGIEEGLPGQHYCSRYREFTTYKCDCFACTYGILI